jgi:hypothetical protein
VSYVQVSSPSSYVGRGAPKIVHHEAALVKHILIGSRARKVKCDEIKPVCNRCRSTGRTCEGYGIWGGGGNGYAERYHPKPKEIRSIVPHPLQTKRLNPEEGKHMQWFHSHVIQSISGCFEPAFWTDLVVPANWTEPAVAHAVIALSSAYRNDVRRRRGLPGVQGQFTLQQYTKAIHHLRPLLFTRDSAGTIVVLITCLLFTFLEYLRDQHASAALHLHCGLKLLRDIHSDCAEAVHGVLIIGRAAKKRTIDLTILQGFANMHLQANLFGNHLPDVALILQITETELPPPIFISLQEARDSLEKMFHGILLISQRMRPAVLSAGTCPPSLQEAQKLALDHLTAWQTTYSHTMRTLPITQPRQFLADKLLLNYHTLASIMCECIHSMHETTYDEYVSDFISILKRSIDVWKHHKSTQDSSSAGPTTDMGWIPPLYYTALKCRSHRVRLHAIRLLRSVPHKAGLWDSTLAAKIAEKVMQLEERHMIGICSQEDGFALCDVPCLGTMQDISSPVDDRFHEVEIELLETRNVIIGCKQRQGYGTNKVLRCKFDGEMWHDIEEPIILD